MTKFNLLLRGLWLCLPVLLISGVAIVAVSAQTTSPTVQPGRISVKDMPEFESYPSGMNGLAASNPPPLIMLVMSRDEQLFNKAYPDYTDLNNDGKVDTTYLDSFEYNGYFDPNICYVYDTTNKYFKAATSVATGSHQCATGSSYWSGNFMNWVAMSRVDILRWTFYGGTRSTDTATKSVLERAEIPNDIHAWPKVYVGTDIAKYAPFTASTTFCNVSTGTTGTWSGATTTASGVGSTPVIRAASGSWGDWAATEGIQCVVGGDSSRPNSATDYTARVQVCQNVLGTPNESFCVAEGTSLKPEGLLQKYSKSGTSLKRFGLVTGSTVQARIGGQLRRNVGQLQNNKLGTACAPGTGAGDGDEFSNVDGTFCYKGAATKPAEGIVMTLDQLQIKGWDGTNYGTSGNGCYLDASHPWGARGYAIQGNPTRCPDFGNPLAGMYATALQYIQGVASPNKESGTLPTPNWVDPYGKLSDGTARNRECATCSIVLVSSGLNTFDAQNVPSVTGVDASSLTNTIQTKEGISGKYMLSTYYGDTGNGKPANNSLTVAGTNYSDAAICQPATIGKLAAVVGICNGAPGQQGSYLLAGLSYGAWNVDGTQPIRTTGVVSGFRVKTYGVSLSDNLPAFNISVSDKTVSLSPSCRADPAGTQSYTTCYFGDINLTPPSDKNNKNTYGLSPTTDYPNVGSYYIMWEDSQYGSDHDMDADNVISWCVGASCLAPSTVVSGGVKICDPEIFNGAKSVALAEYDSSTPVCKSDGKLNFTPTADDIVIRNETTAFSSGGMYLGYQVSGSLTDGLTELFINNGTNAVFGCSLLADSVDCKSKPQVRRFKFGDSANVASSLQTPLWYAAKYSGFEGDMPTLPVGNSDPSNYFFARNAGALKDQLNTVFQQITSSAANNFGNATTPSSSNDVQGSGLSYQVQYFQQRNGVKWTGSLQAFWSDSDGYQREGTDNGAQELTVDAKYVTSGADKSEGALAGAMTSYRCSVVPASSDDGTAFDASTNAACSVVSDGNALHPAWDAGNWLNAYYDPKAAANTSAATAIENLAKQRVYSAATDLAGASQRYIFTYLTSKANGKSATGTVLSGTQTDFVWNGDSCDADGKYTLNSTSGFCGTFKNAAERTGNYSLLNELAPDMAKKLVNWVRGVEYPDDYRSRTGTTAGDATKGIPAVTYTYRLGDIVDSSPMVVGTPAESYDLLYSDYSFAAFRANYRDRRQMVYLGANDGMLHAFNGGFYVPGHADPDPTKVTNPTIVRQLTDASKMTTGSSVSTLGQNWQLGQEVWAFVPDNLIPHLRWLADKNYSHVFYVDGSPVVSDVQIFTSTSAATGSQCLAGTSTVADSKGHICGWGTVMVVPFRLGGGAISVDTVGDGKDASFQQSNSAYVILDVTDPEQPPTVLGEITMGTYTTAAPAFSVHREADGKLHYLLTVGSGPIDNGGPNSASGDKPVQAASGSNLTVRVYDLADIVAKTETPVVTLNNGPANSFAGDMVASDFDLNNSSEAVYFGVVTNPSDPDLSKPTGVFGGGLWKLDMNTAAATDSDGNANNNPMDTSDPSTWTLAQVIDTAQPVTIRPTVALDSTGRAMVYFGTGRSFTTNDDSGASAQGVQQQYIYGVSDNSLLGWLGEACKEMPATGPLFDAAGVAVTSEDGVSGLPEDGFNGITTMDALVGQLTARDPTTGCYNYSGWKLALGAGNSGASVQQPSERVVSSQVLYNGILLTPSYIPANLLAKTAAKQSECNPVPVPGTSNLYGMNYQTGTADPSLAGSFGSSGGKVSNKVNLGSGKASSPVLHVGNGTVTAAFGLSGGTKLQKIGALSGASNGEISWREPMDNQ